LAEPRESGFGGDFAVKVWLRDIGRTNNFLYFGALLLQPADRMVRIKCLER
jgi:hypothetical protein